MQKKLSMKKWAYFSLQIMKYLFSALAVMAHRGISSSIYSIFLSTSTLPPRFDLISGIHRP
jgi:hypothetical protein